MVLDLQLDNHYLLEKALSILQDGITILDKECAIVYINHEAQQLFRRSSDENPTVGDIYLDYVSQHNVARIKNLIDQAFEGSTSTFIVSIPQSEEITWFEMTCHPIPEDSSLINHVCLKVKNITDKVLLENQLELQRQRERRKIIKAAIDAQEKERTEIGKELHDNINQTLTTVKLYNEIVFEDFLPNKSLLEKSISILNKTINEIRQLSKQLSGPAANTLSLKDLVLDLVESINIMQKVHVIFNYTGLNDVSLPNDFKTGIFRIIQEQITNILKHAKASKIYIDIVNSNKQLSIKIVDNGIGFTIKGDKKGVGLINMISRAEALGGTLNIQSEPFKGCSLLLDLPL